MHDFVLDIPVLKQTIADLNKGVTDLNKIWKTAEKVKNNTKNAWTGKSALAFIEKIDVEKIAFNLYVNEIKDLVDSLKYILTEAEKMNKQAISFAGFVGFTTNVPGKDIVSINKVKIQQAARTCADLDDIYTAQHKTISNAGSAADGLKYARVVAVWEFDTIKAKINNTKKKISELKVALEKYQREMQTLEEEACAKFHRVGNVSATDEAMLDSWIAGLAGKDITEIAVEDKERLIALYESLNPEDKEKMDKFLEPIAKCGHDEDILNIKAIVYTADEPYKTLLLANISKISVFEHHSEESKLFKDQGFCVPIFKSILFSLENDGLSDPCGPYFTLFHEIGHGIDDASKALGYKTAAYIDSDFNSNMYDIIKDEATTHIKNTIASFISNPDEQDAIYNAIMYGGNPDILSKAQKDIYDKVVEQYKTDFNFVPGKTKEDYGQFNVVTDMFSAFVGSNDNRSIFGGYAHDTSYWHGISPFGIGLVGGEFVGMEFFAGYYSSCITGDTAQRDIIRDYFPNACDAMDRMMEEMAASIK